MVLLSLGMINGCRVSLLLSLCLWVGGWWWFVVCAVVRGVGNEPCVLRQCIHMVVTTANVEI
jgi:hypothetical protein